MSGARKWVAAAFAVVAFIAGAVFFAHRDHAAGMASMAAVWSALGYAELLHQAGE